MTGPQFRLQTLAELEQEPPSRDLWQGILAEDGLAVAYAQSGVGKTFFTIRLMVSVSEGVPLHGRHVKQGAVIVVVMEGGGRYHQRLRAACDALSIDQPIQIFICRDSLYLHDGASVAAFIAAVREKLDGQPVALTVIDTLARASAGSDESKTADRELTVDGLRAIQRLTGGAIFAVHHTGWNDARMRGGYNLQCAADTILKLEAGETDGALTLTVEKVRDGEDGFKLAGVLTPHLGSLVYDPAELADAVADPGRLSKSALRTLQALQDIALSDGATSTEWVRADPGSDANHFKIRKQIQSAGFVAKVGKGRYIVSPSGLELLSLSFDSQKTLKRVGNNSTLLSPPIKAGESGVPERKSSTTPSRETAAPVGAA
jgi:hypothetical protein